MLRGRLISLTRSLALSGALLLVSIGLNAQLNTDGTDRRLLLGHGAAPDNPRAVAAEYFADLVEEHTDGRLDVQVMGAEALGSDSEMMVQVGSGTLDITINSQGAMSVLVPEVGLFGLPYLFDSPEHAFEVIDGQVGDRIAELSEERGYSVLAWWDNGIRHTTHNGGEVQGPEDLAGLRIRVPDDPMTVAIFNRFRANPTPMDFGELYLGLRQGAVDGQENPLVNIAASRLDEVQQDLTLTAHKYETNPFVVSTQTWSSLDGPDREVLREAAVEARDHQRALMAEETERILAEFEQSMTVTTPDRDALAGITGPVRDLYEQRFPDLVSELEHAARTAGAERTQP